MAPPKKPRISPIFTPRGAARHTPGPWLSMSPVSLAQCAGGGAPPMEWVLGVAARCNHNPKVRITPEPISGTLRDGFFVMKLSFDIAGDLDTPVSAFAK